MEALVGIDIDALLQPVAGDGPSGPNLEYDTQFLELEAAVRVRPEQQYGDRIYPAQCPNWDDVHARAVALFDRTKDLRVAISLLRATTRTHGWAGFTAAMKLVCTLVERHWDSVHPQPDAEDGNDPTMRINALISLADAETVLADVRMATPDGAASGVTTREIELAWGMAAPIRDETVRAPADILQMLSRAEYQSSGCLRYLYQAHYAVLTIDRFLAERVPTAGIDLAPLRRLTQLLTRVAMQALGERTGLGRFPLPFATRQSSTIKVLTPEECRQATLHVRRVCDWLEANNLVDQAPSLILRSHRLAAQSFADILGDVVPKAGDPMADLDRNNQT